MLVDPSFEMFPWKAEVIRLEQAYSWTEVDMQLKYFKELLQILEFMAITFTNNY